MQAELEQQKALLQNQLRDAEVERSQSMQRQGDTINGAIESIMANVQQLASQIEQHASSMKGSQVVAVKRIKGPDGRLVGGIQVRADGSEIPIHIQ
jgi:hypothetical protein